MEVVAAIRKLKQRVPTMYSFIFGPGAQAPPYTDRATSRATSARLIPDLGKEGQKQKERKTKSKVKEERKKRGRGRR